MYITHENLLTLTKIYCILTPIKCSLWASKATGTSNLVAMLSEEPYVQHSFTTTLLIKGKICTSSIPTYGMFTLHGNGNRTVTGNGTGTIGDNRSGPSPRLSAVWPVLHNIYIVIHCSWSHSCSRCRAVWMCLVDLSHETQWKIWCSPWIQTKHIPLLVRL